MFSMYIKKWKIEINLKLNLKQSQLEIMAELQTNWGLDEKQLFFLPQLLYNV